MVATVYEAFEASRASYAERPFLHIPATACAHYSEAAITRTYSDMGGSAASLANIYQASGFSSGHRVALILENRPDFFAHWLALNSLGVSVVPVNGELRAEEIAYQLEHSESDLVVALTHKHELVEAAFATMAAPPPLITETLDGIKTPQAEPIEASIGAQTECALLYTSGSTGKPKGCILSNDYFTLMGAWYRDIGGLCHLEPGVERLITPLPLSHMNAMATSAMGMMMTGGCIVQLDRFHPSTWWNSVTESAATVVHYLGVMPAILLAMDDEPRNFGAQVKFGFGAGVNPRHHAVFEERFGFPLIEAWAMTESGSGGCVVANHEPIHVGTSCFGHPPEALEYRLVDEQNQDVSDGEPGELLVRARGDEPQRGYFSGYLKNEQATIEAWAGGWLHTGDVVRRGEDGSLHFVDRRKNVIRRSGENIAALEVEAALVLDPSIAEVVVTAAPDELRGDEVLAAIILKDKAQSTAENALAIFERCLENLAYFKAPGYIVFVDEIPRTASQKPQRGEIKKNAATWLTSEGCNDLRHMKKRSRV